MTRALFLSLLLAALAGPLHAACYADYKAKMDDPLRLHYGVAEIRGECSRRAAAAELAPRLQSRGWELLNVVSVFDDGGLAERRDSAGRHYLRY